MVKKTLEQFWRELVETYPFKSHLVKKRDINSTEVLFQLKPWLKLCLPLFYLLLTKHEELYVPRSIYKDEKDHRKVM